MPMTFGIEEEFILLDPARLEPVDLGARAAEQLCLDAAGTASPEFFASQLEHATPILRTFSQALADLTAFRVRLARWADGMNVVPSASGTPLRTCARPALSPGERYAQIAEHLAGLTRDHQINGLHVHVGVSDRDDRVKVANGLRAWLPVLLILSANSPFWGGRDTGFESWRMVHSLRLATCGIPPVFRDVQDYDTSVRALVDVGAISDLRALNWSVRLSSRYPTVEVRICDAQLDPATSVALASIIRALAEGVLVDPAPSIDIPWDAVLWRAARYGLDAGVVDPLTGQTTPAPRVLHTLRERVAPYVADADEQSAIDGFLDDVLTHGTGATAQRRALRRGKVSLACLCRARFAAAGGRETLAALEPDPNDLQVM